MSMWTRSVGACMLAAWLMAAGRPPAEEVVVSAASSLAELMRGLATAFERDTGVHVAVNLGASNTLARQIVNGAPVDLFVSADEAQMDVVDRSGALVPGSRVDWLSNQLAIVVPKGARTKIAGASDLTGSAVGRIAVGDPAAVPAGVYARQWLESRGLWRPLQPRLLPSVNVRAALAAVESGNAEAAIVFVTDARQSTRAEIAAIVPRDEGPPIRYPIALLRHSGARVSARRFYEYLLSAPGRNMAREAGFIPLDD